MLNDNSCHFNCELMSSLDTPWNIWNVLLCGKQNNIRNLYFNAGNAVKQYTIYEWKGEIGFTVSQPYFMPKIV